MVHTVERVSLHFHGRVFKPANPLTKLPGIRITMELQQPIPALSKRDYLLFGVFAFAKVLIHLVFNGWGHYNYFRDEYYYIDCSDHLGWGYVDHPPLSILILWLTRLLIGDSLLAIRIPVIIAGAATVVIAGLITRAMGGGRTAQALACLTFLFAPVYLTFSSFFSMNAFDVLIWASAVYVLVQIVQTDNPRLWIWFGIIAGLGMENKVSVGFLGAALAVMMAFTPQRKHYLKPQLWIGGAIAGAIFLPHLIWQAANEWPTREFMYNATHYKNVPLSLSKFIEGQLLMMNPASSLIWIAGIVFAMAAREGKRFRLFALMYVFLVIVFWWTNGKVYYVAPAYPLIVPLGAIAWERMTTRSRWVAGIPATLIIVVGALISPLAIPVLMPDAFFKYQTVVGKPPQQEKTHAGPLPQHLGDRIGWEEMVSMIDGAYKTLSESDRAKCAILVSNYGEAGAVNLYGPKLGLPRAISGHMTNYLWGPQGATGEVVLAYWDDKSTLDELFTEVTEVRRIHHMYVMHRQNNRPLYLCRGMKVPMDVAWQQFKRYR
jgi:hypothetical protein